MTTFSACTKTLAGGLIAHAAVDAVFPLFSPQGERLWVPGWDPEILHPGPDLWEEQQVFRTREESGEVVWVVARLDPTQHIVDYHRVEPGVHVTHVRVCCRGLSANRTQVSTAYSLVGLSEAGNQKIAAMTRQAYEARMNRWEEWINGYLEGETR